MDKFYIENKKDGYHVMFERCHSKVLDHYTRYSVTSFDTEEKAYNKMTSLSKHTGISY